MNNLTNEEIETVKKALTEYVDLSSRFVNKKETDLEQEARYIIENKVAEIVKKI